MITSTSNPQVKNIIQLNQKGKARKEQGLFVAEGRKMFLEAPAGWIHRVYVSESFWEGFGTTRAADDLDSAVRQRLRGGVTGDSEMEVVSDQVFEKMSDTKTPQGVLTVVKTPVYDLKQFCNGVRPLVVIENLQDPGNVGTILRTAEGAGAAGVILAGNCADILSPKVIRSTMGSIYRMPFLQVPDVVLLLKLLKEHGIRSYAASLDGEHSYDEERYPGGTAFLIGNEGNGLTPEAQKAADCLIRIPMEGKVESLNAAMAAGLLMYEAARQRRNAGRSGVCERK